MTYIPGGPAVSWTVNAPGGLGGFELSPRIVNGNLAAGNLASGTGSTIQAPPQGSPGYPYQYANQTSPAASWVIQWTPPATNVGDINVYVTGVASCTPPQGQDGEACNSYITSYKLTPASAITLNPKSLTFNYNGITPPTKQTFSVSTGSSSLPFTTSVSTTDGADWLSATPSGITGSNVTVTADPTGLAPGPYTGTVSVAVDGTSNTPQTVAVTFSVAPPPLPSITVAPAALTFNYNGSPLSTQSFTVSSTGSNVAFTTTVGTVNGGSWLSATPNGTTPGSVIVTVNPATLAPGSYHGSVTVNAPGTANTPQTVNVSLNVAAPSIILSPTSLAFTYTGTPISPQIVQVTSSGSAFPFTTAVSTTTGGSWLSATAGASTPGSVTVTANPAGLAPGQYIGVVTVTAVGAANTPQTLAVSLAVGPTLTTTATALNFTYLGTSPAAQTFQVTSSSGAVPFTTSASTTSGGSWLSATASGTTPGTVTVAVNPTGLAPGHYTGTILITAPAASNSPQTVTVSLDFPTITTTPTALNFAYVGTPLAAQSFQVTSSSGPVPFSTSISTTSGGNWLSATPNGTTPGTVSVTIDATGLAPGHYVGTVSVMAPVATNSPQTLAVTLTVISPSALLFVPLQPCRVADTRNADGPFGGPALAAKQERAFALTQSNCQIPSTAAAYSVNVTAVPKSKLGYLTVWPTGQTQPYVSTLNSYDGRVKANAAIVTAGTNGEISLYATDDTDVVIDVNGYFVSPATNAAGLQFYPVTPCRLVDTRNASGPLGGPSFQKNDSRDFPILESECNVPSAAQAYSVNVTAVPTNGKVLGYLSMWPSGKAQPYVSTLNSWTGTVVANAALIPAGPNGGISVFTSDPADVVIDIDGYFAPSGAGGLYLNSLGPCRALDTRNPSGAQPTTGLIAPTLDPGCAIPGTTQALLLNATVVPQHNLGFLSLWPAGNPEPDASTLNSWDGAVVSNMAIVPTNNGAINAYTSDPSYLVLDVMGYFAP
jgi:hypothetical protein